MSRILKAATEFWQGVAALIAITAAVITAVNYFATRAYVTKVECVANHNLLEQTLPIRMSLLEMNIRLLKSELDDVGTGTRAHITLSQEIEKSQKELDALRARRQALVPQTSQTCEADPGRKP